MKKGEKMPNNLNLTEVLIHITNEKGTPMKEVKEAIITFRNLSKKEAEDSIKLAISNKVIKKNKKGELIPLVKSQF